MNESLQKQLLILRQRIHVQEAEIAMLERECAQIQREMRSFEGSYNRIVKPIADQLEAVENAIESLKNLQLEQQLGEALSIEDLWRSMDAKPSQSAIPPMEELAASAKKPTDKPHSQLKQLYRRLARRFHPDLAKDEADRVQRNKMMSLINTAYQERDLDALEALDESGSPQLDEEQTGQKLSLDTLTLRRLQQQYRDLAVRIHELKVRRSQLKYGPMMELKLADSLARKRGENMLQQLADDMQREYWERVTELDRLKSEINP